MYYNNYQLSTLSGDIKNENFDIYLDCKFSPIIVTNYWFPQQENFTY